MGSKGSMCGALAMMVMTAFAVPGRAQATPAVDVAAVSDGTFHAAPGAGAEEAYLPILSPASHAANLIQLRNGDILCFWFSGTKEGASGVSIVMSRLPHGSRQWTKTELIHRETGRSYQNPVIFQDPTGVLWLFHSSQAANQGETNAHVLLLQSMDNGSTWSAPKVEFANPGSFTREPVVVTDSGSWLLPIFYVLPGDARKTNYSAVEVSDDHGKTWHECVVPKTTPGLVQPNIIRLRSNSYVMFMRSRNADFVYRSTSSDGCHWTDPVATVLPNNNASVQGVKLRNGHLVLTFDNIDEKLRFPLSIALSEDNGVTWKYVRDIEPGPPGIDPDSKVEFSYPSVIQERNGKIMVAYTYNRQTIKVVEFEEKWIRHGSTRGKYNPAISQ